jgi:RNA polymerase sigma-70 factor (ECF subfamily)
MTPSYPRAEMLLAELPDDVVARMPPPAELEAWLGDAIDAALLAWPGLGVGEDELISYLATKVPLLPEPSGYRQLRTTDLYLALGCSKKDPASLARFAERYEVVLQQTLERMRLTPDVAADYRSSLRETLFFPSADALPLITTFSGRGDLASWLRSIATRAALKIRSKERRNVELDDALDVIAAEGNPELQVLRSRYAREFQEALVAAFDALEPRQRNLLRQRYLDGLSIDATGRLYRVHRATAARWLAEAREAVMVGVKDHLRARAGLTDSELDSMLRMARSGFEMSLSALFRR